MVRRILAAGILVLLAGAIVGGMLYCPAFNPKLGPPDPIPVRLAERTESLRLSEFAQKHADFCQEHNQFIHSRIGEAVSRYGEVRENIAKARNWAEAFALWEMSPPHAANLREGGPYIGFANAGDFYIIIFAERP